MVMDVGTHLRNARERRGQTIEQVARATKLSPSMVRRIERNQWDTLPGGLLTRGHLRAYAAEVGLDPEEIVREYLKELPPEAVRDPPIRVRPAVESSRSGAQALLTVAVGILLTIATWQWFGARPSSAPTSSRGAPVEPPVADEPRVVRPDVPDAVPAVERAGRRLSLEIDVTGPCWVSAKADGRQVAFRLLQAGDILTVAADEELVLRVGDAGSFTYTLNGVPGRALGDRGQPVTVTINESNLRSFLTAAPDGPTRG